MEDWTWKDHYHSLSSIGDASNLCSFVLPLIFPTSPRLWTYLEPSVLYLVLSISDPSLAPLSDHDPLSSFFALLSLVSFTPKFSFCPWPPTFYFLCPWSILNPYLRPCQVLRLNMERSQSKVALRARLYESVYVSCLYSKYSIEISTLAGV